jgi:hypothetical protein
MTHLAVETPWDTFRRRVLESEAALTRPEVAQRFISECDAARPIEAVTSERP